jgi:hypothetical protein
MMEWVYIFVQWALSSVVKIALAQY